ncbi:MAG: nucleotidyltransferase family protein [Bacteriovoracia bacterium]
MRALLLAGGYGTRLRPLTLTIPKCLVPIHGRPLLDYWLETLDSPKIDGILVNTHYKPEAVNEFIAQSRHRKKVTLVHEPSLLGTGGTILANESFFGGEDFMVVHADNLSLFRVEDFIQAHKNRPENCLITMMTFETDSPSTCGIVELDAKGLVRAFHEKVPNPPGNLANGAVYIFSPEVMTMLKALRKPVIDLSTEILPRCLGRILTFKNTRYHRDIGSPEALALAESETKNLLT